jgi:hypothetical protein
VLYSHINDASGQLKCGHDAVVLVAVLDQIVGREKLSVWTRASHDESLCARPITVDAELVAPGIAEVYFLQIRRQQCLIACMRTILRFDAGNLVDLSVQPREVAGSKLLTLVLRHCATELRRSAVGRERLCGSEQRLRRAVTAMGFDGVYRRDRIRERD